MSLLQHLQSIQDPRMARCRRHHLQSILVMALCATLAGADNWVEVAQFAQTHQQWFARLMGLPSGTPSHDTFARVFRLLDAQEVERACQQWLEQVAGQVQGTVAIDGKSVRGSGKAGVAALHLVSAWAADMGLLLGQRKVDGKSNEITAIPELLKLLHLRGCIVTIDAMGCQQDIAGQLHKSGADYVLSLKANQRHMHAVVEQHFAQANVAQNHHGSTYTESSQEHGRCEQRSYAVRAVPAALERAAAHWPGLASVVQVRRTRQLKGKSASEQTTSTSYYLSSLPAHTSADVLAHSIRAHRAVENQLHWSLDVALREDAAQSYKDQGPHNQSLLRRMALQLLKADTSVKVGLQAKRKRAGWNLDYLAQILGITI